MSPFTSFDLARRCLHRVLPAVALSALLLVPVGCADTIASSKPSRSAGLKLYTEGSYVDAAGAFRNAVRQDPRDYKSHYYLGASYDALKSYHQAIQSYRAALDVMNVTFKGRGDEEFRTRILDGLANSLAKGGDRTTVTEALGGTKVTQAEVKFTEAKVARILGDADTALIDYKQAMLLDPQDFYIAKEYGLYLQSLGQAPQANIVLRRAYAINSRDKQVNAALAQLGVVTGPSLKDRDDLVKPPVPEGPLPEVDWTKVGSALTGRGGNRPRPPEATAAEPAGARLEPDLATDADAGAAGPIDDPQGFTQPEFTPVDAPRD